MRSQSENNLGLHTRRRCSKHKKQRRPHRKPSFLNKEQNDAGPWGLPKIREAALSDGNESLLGSSEDRDPTTKRPKLAPLNSSEGETHGDGSAATATTINQAVALNIRTVTNTSGEPEESNELTKLHTLNDVDASDTRETLNNTSEFIEKMDNLASGKCETLIDPESPNNSARSDNPETTNCPNISEDRDKSSNSPETLNMDMLDTPDTSDKLEPDMFGTSNIEHTCQRCHLCEDKPITVKKLMAAAGIGNTFSNTL